MNSAVKELARPARSHHTDTAPGTRFVQIPRALPVMPENVPRTLRAAPNWVLWRYQQRAGRLTKLPYQPNGRLASVIEPRTWSSFECILKVYADTANLRQFDGIGLVLDGKADPAGKVIAAVDIDKAVGDPIRMERARQIIRKLAAYTELSPSGRGYRIFCTARPLKSGISRDGVELYTSGRYLTVTGQKVELDEL